MANDNRQNELMSFTQVPLRILKTHIEETKRVFEDIENTISGEIIDADYWETPELQDKVHKIQSKIFNTVRKITRIQETLIDLKISSEETARYIKEEQR